MSRALQHIADKLAVDAAKESGEKVTWLCGGRSYPMTEMKDSIPTCSKCMREALADWNTHARQTSSTWNVTLNNGNGYSARWLA